MSVSKKALPKAIRRMTDDTPEVIVVPGANGQHETPVPPASPTERSNERVAANPAQVSDVVGAVPVQAASSPTPTVLVRPRWAPRSMRQGGELRLLRLWNAMPFMRR